MYPLLIAWRMRQRALSSFTGLLYIEQFRSLTGDLLLEKEDFITFIGNKISRKCHP